MALRYLSKKFYKMLIVIQCVTSVKTVRTSELFGTLPWWEKAQDITKFNITFSAVTGQSCHHNAAIPASLSKRRWRASNQVPWALITGCSRNPVTLEQSLMFKPTQLWEKCILQFEVPVSEISFNYLKGGGMVHKMDRKNFHSTATQIYTELYHCLLKRKKLTMSHLIWQCEK